MIKTFQQFLISFFLISNLLISCQKNDYKHPELWNSIDLLMKSNPKQALTELSKISPDTLDAWDYMRYGILLTQAQDKSYIDHTSDSLMNVVALYCDSLKAPRDLHLRSHYYRGRVYHDMDRSTMAIQDYLITLKIANELQDHEFIGLSATNIGRVLVKNRLFELADEFYAIGQKSIEQTNDTVKLFIIWINRAYIDMDIDTPRYAEAEKKLERAYSLSHNLAPVFKQRARMAFSSLYSLVPDHQKTIDWSRAAILVQPDTARHGDNYLLMGKAYLHLNNLDSAQYCLQKSTFSYKDAIRYNAYANLAEVARDQGLWKQALTWNDSSHYYFYKMEAQRRSADIVSDIKDFEHSESLKSYLKQSRKKQNTLYIFICAVLLSFLLITYDYVMTRRRSKVYVYQMEVIKERFSEKIDEIEHLNNLLMECEEDKAQVAILKLQIEQAKSETTTAFNNILPGLSSYRATQELLAKADKLSPSEENISKKLWRDIEFELNCVTNNFTSRLLQKYPDLKQADVRYCCLLKMGFRYKDMSLLLGRTPRMMYNRRTKISQLLHLSDDETLEGFLEQF